MHVHPEPSARAPWSALVLLAVAQFMVVLDVTVSNVALPSIAADLRIAAGDRQWVVTAYVLCAGGLLLVGGRAADLLGRRRTFLAGLALFTLASLASGLAWSPASLIGSRALQGVGAALLTPSALSLLVTTYAGAQRTTALAAWGAIGSGGAAAGMLAGGALTTWAGWEWVYLVNVPVGVVAAALAPAVLPAPAPLADSWRRLDLPGALTLVAGLGVLVYALQTTTWSLVVVAAALLGAFAAIERRAPSPIVPPATWRSPTLTGGVVVMLVGTGLLVGTFYVSSLYLQGVAGYSALQAGLAFLPIAVAIGVAAHAAGHVLPTAGARTVAAAGLLLLAGGVALLGSAPADPSYATELLPGFLGLGLGIGLVLPAASVTAMSHVLHEDAGVASGTLSTAHEVGAALGVAALGAASGHHDAMVIAAVAALALAALVALRLPAVRPPQGAAAHLH